MNRRIPTLLAILIIFVVIATIVGIVFWLFPNYPENEAMYFYIENARDETADWNNQRNEIAEEIPEQVILDFYQCYTKAILDHKIRTVAIDGCNYLEEEYENSLLQEKWTLADPIFWAQDIPAVELGPTEAPLRDIQISKAEIKEKTASAFVTFFPSWPEHKLKISLMFIDDKWKINNIEHVINEK